MIKVTNLTKRFGATVALSNVSAEFNAGEVHCLLGENGAGKSTIGKIVSGLYQPDDGQIEVDGQVQTIASPKAAHKLGIAICYQELSLAKHLSVRANLCLGSETFKLPFTRVDNKGEKERVSAVLRKLGLDVDMEQMVGQLPVAQQQLIEIGKALMQNPRVVIFDEPTAMLGAVEKRKFLDVLEQLRKEGVAAILVTHHIEDVMAVSDRVTIMRNGKVVDSFAMTPEITAEIMVERLTGKKRERLQALPTERPVSDKPSLIIEKLRWRNRVSQPIRVHRGQIISLYGVVGCGAEIIIGALAGQAPAPHLRIVLGEKEFQPKSAAQALRSGVAYLPSGRAANCILPARSIMENLTLGTLHHHAKGGLIGRSAEATYADTTLRNAGVKFADASLPITSLSGGNQQKVLLARAMAAAQELLVLEEPSAGVDIDAKAQIHERIREAANKGVTVVVLSSDLEETISLSDVIYTMYRSEVAGIYENPDISDQPSIIADVLGQRSPGTSPDIAAAA
ncbi:sugar ABC transporter ATP-binding protein [Herbaspirillum sp. LeCh32-8]|uniref:sugar ABC transporter ATP-binding protein n=1 Tax=Herbaspirillum sp. LeCh32-8 TaxID=2821356 RepID=UPI001AE248D1|nr:sugar ABC transporter ATP-binding protein [Herbaspirillum sp. LeCh32-8]MBP0598864.1 sugar ABC transporter ATP-binding protein [Herbaspirillum sp. LeCh32-8]